MQENCYDVKNATIILVEIYNVAEVLLQLYALQIDVNLLNLFKMNMRITKNVHAYNNVWKCYIDKYISIYKIYIYFLGFNC